MKHTVPMRTCVGCGQRDPQSQLLRFALSADGSLTAGPSRGRGGYLHPRRSCTQTFAKARPGFVRSLRVIVPQEVRIRYLALVERNATLLS